MQQRTFGAMIVQFRKEKGMTQLELAQQLGITDKAVSKWERDLSYPDVASIPKIAEIFGVSVDELMQTKQPEAAPGKQKIRNMVPLALKAVALAMGIAVAVLSFLGQMDPGSAIGMLGIGLACLAMTQFLGKEAV